MRHRWWIRRKCHIDGRATSFRCASIDNRVPHLHRGDAFTRNNNICLGNHSNNHRFVYDEMNVNYFWILWGEWNTERYFKDFIDRFDYYSIVWFHWLAMIECLQRWNFHRKIEFREWKRWQTEWVILYRPVRLSATTFCHQSTHPP